MSSEHQTGWRSSAYFSAIVLAALICGCNRESQTVKVSSASSAPASAKVALPAGLMVKTAPAGAKEIIDVRKNAKDGDEVTVHGRIGGKEEPFSSEIASVQMTDASLKFCSEVEHMKGCKTPWDMCCDDPGDVAAKSVTVRVTGEDGQPLKGTLNGAGGLKPMSDVIVRGTLRRRAADNAVVIDASELFVKAQ